MTAENRTVVNAWASGQTAVDSMQLR